jgi:hypothetical protein
MQPQELANDRLGLGLEATLWRGINEIASEALVVQSVGTRHKPQTNRAKRSAVFAAVEAGQREPGSRGREAGICAHKRTVIKHASACNG